MTAGRPPTPPSLAQSLHIAPLIAISATTAVILGIILGHISLRHHLRDLRGRGLGIAGVVIGYVYIGIILLVIALAVLVVGLYAASH